MTGDWLLFFLSAAVVVAAGSVLAICAEIIVRRRNLNALFFGAVAVALVTSLPELVTAIAAVRRDAPALALGELFGSNMANMAILATMTLAFASRRLLQSAASANAMTAVLAAILTAFALILTILELPEVVAGIGGGALLVGAAFLVGSFSILERQQKAEADDDQSDVASSISLGKAQAGFLLAAAAIVAAGPQLAASSDVLAEETGVGDTFFGTFSLALVTSLPELSVSFAALRIGAGNLAVANLLGSNATNMALILPLDLAYADGPLLRHAEDGLLVAGVAAILLMALAIFGLTRREERRQLRFDSVAVLMIVVYVAGLWAAFATT
jgi:cation:H+ antiporter